MAAELTQILETGTRQAIDRALLNLGWNTDEFDRLCTVTTGRARTTEETAKLLELNANGAFPDYVLYDLETWRPVAVLEAKRPGSNMASALKQGRDYARALGSKVTIAIDGGLTEAVWSETGLPLRDRGLTVNELLSPEKLLRFVETGTDLTYAAEPTKTREDLIRVFKRANELLRQQGMREGLERFTEFSNLLFLKLIDEIERDRKSNGETERIAARYRWSGFEDKDPAEMLDYINEIVLPKLVDRYNHSGDVFSRRLGITDPEILQRVVKELGTLTLLDVDSDVKGDAFEYFLKNSVSVGNDLGEYYTPRHIVKLMVELVNPQFGDKIYDPCCGTGGFLIEAFRHIKRGCRQTRANMKILENETIYGGELTGTAKLAKMNMILAGDGHANIRQLDSLEHRIKGEYDVILSNFPFSQRTQFAGLYGLDSRSANPVFLAHILDALADGGRAAVVVPDSSLYGKTTSALAVRKRLLTEFTVIAVIQLDPFVFSPYTKQPTSILVFEKRRSNGPVYFFDVINDGFSQSTRRIPISANDLSLLRNSWTSQATTDQSFLISHNAIVENDHVLFTNAYVPRRIASETIKLSELVDDLVIGSTPSRAKHDSFTGDIPWAKIADMGSPALESTTESITQEAADAIGEARLVPEGSLLMSFKLSIGRTSITAAPMYTNEAIVYLNLKAEFDNDTTKKYLYYVLRTIDYRPYAVRATKGLTLNSTSMKDVDVPFPDPARRREIVQELDSIDRAVQEKLVEVEALRSDILKRCEDLY